MRFVRITKRKHQDSAFSGEGARLFGGRWNNKNNAAVYLADSIALAQLEILVHLHSYDSLDHYAMFELDIPDHLVARLSDSEYPDDWNSEEAPKSTKAIGDEFLNDKTALVLQVRSSVVPQQFNGIFNPEHPDASAVLAGVSAVPASFDPRLHKR